MRYSRQKSRLLDISDTSCVVVVVLVMMIGVGLFTSSVVLRVMLVSMVFVMVTLVDRAELWCLTMATVASMVV